MGGRCCGGRGGIGWELGPAALGGFLVNAAPGFQKDRCQSDDDIALILQVVEELAGYSPVVGLVGVLFPDLCREPKTRPWRAPSGCMDWEGI